MQAIPEKRVALLIVAALLLMFAIVSWVAVSGKSSTYDEPVHALGSWLVLHFGDFRIDPENPPLWQHWAGLANGADAIRVDMDDPEFRAVLHRDQDLRYQTTVRWLYQTPPNDGERFVRRSRVMMIFVALAGGFGVVWWCWRIAGASAGVAGATLFALDPNFLGHAPLVKNDVALAAAILWLAIATWSLGRRLTAPRIANIALALAAAITIKFTALIAPAIVALLLLIRALSREPWSGLERRSQKLLAAVGVLVACAMVCYLAIWACYHFRFDATPEANAALERETVYRAALSRGVTPGIVYDLAEFAERHRLLPQAFLNGVMYQILMAHERQMFLCGLYSYTGWWYYFPLAALFKTPVTTLIALAATFGWAIAQLMRNRPTPQIRWTIVCLLLPASILLISAMASGVNVGLRHIFPACILAYVAAGIVVGKIWNAHGARIKWLVSILGMTLAIESFSAFPDYIAYFNFLSGGSRGSLALLSDSNLDWGQDLPLLAKWQRDNPTTPMYLLYFGTARGYGITLNPPAPNQDAVVAISATYLQGLYTDPDTLRQIAYVRKHDPFAILGGTIYLYRWTAADNLAMQQQEQTP
jgi:hypothetical protein